MADLPVEIVQLIRDEEEHDAILLRDEQGRLLYILIGVCEAAAIWVRLQPDKAAPLPRRPWSHDLITAMLERLGAQIIRVVIDGVSNQTFFATIHLQYQDRELVVDARPSDAIALLLRMPAPLLVNAEVMDEVGIVPENGNGDQDYWGEVK